MNDNINIVLKKYFEGQTNLEEEKLIKEYFSSSQVSGEHELYRALFETLQLEKSVVMKEPLRPVYSLYKKRSFKIISFTAAAVLAMILVFPPMAQSKDTYAIINGQKITEQEFIQEYTIAKLEKQFEIINKNLEPLENIQTIKNGVESGVNSLRNIKNSMGGIHEKLKFLHHEKDSSMLYMPDSDGGNG